MGMKVLDERENYCEVLFTGDNAEDPEFLRILYPFADPENFNRARYRAPINGGYIVDISGEDWTSGKQITWKGGSCVTWYPCEGKLSKKIRKWLRSTT
jgi:hypothetical protein